MSDKVLDQSRVDGQGGFTLSVAGRTFAMLLLHEKLTTEEPVIRFASAAEHVTRLDEFTKATQSDVALSDVGKAQRLDPEREKILKWLAGHLVEIDGYAKRACSPCPSCIARQPPRR